MRCALYSSRCYEFSLMFTFWVLASCFMYGRFCFCCGGGFGYTYKILQMLGDFISQWAALLLKPLFKLISVLVLAIALQPWSRARLWRLSPRNTYGHCIHQFSFFSRNLCTNKWMSVCFLWDFFFFASFKNILQFANLYTTVPTQRVSACAKQHVVIIPQLSWTQETN